MQMTSQLHGKTDVCVRFCCANLKHLHLRSSLFASPAAKKSFQFLFVYILLNARRQRVYSGTRLILSVYQI